VKEMNLLKVRVEKLFGLYDYEIPINNIEGITIIHAPNGYGKTAILRLVEYAINGNFEEANKIPFSRFTVYFDNGTLIELDKENSEDTHRFSIPNISYKIIKNGEMKEYSSCEGYKFDYYDRMIRRGKIPTMAIEKKLPFMKRLGPNIWLDRRTGREHSWNDILEEFRHVFAEEDELGECISEVKASIPVHFIKANRLMRSDMIDNQYSNSINGANKLNSAVLEHAKELANSMENVLSKSAALSQELDRTFPARLMRMMLQRNGSAFMTEEEINKELEILEEKRKNLEEVGLLNFGAPVTVEASGGMDDAVKKVLTLYIEDTEKKLKAFNELEQKINLMKQIISEKFRNKEIKFSKDKGFTFKMPDNSILMPDMLSSGEQNELILIYELLFKAKPNSLILIDEPEISLHISWQIQFLKDMIDISKITDCKMIIATHSPDIIDSRWDLTVDLGGDYR
jgi:predicted ATP-binding protein involved in virulence